MSFMSAASMVRRARVAQEGWNSEHSDNPVPWEWVEEALLAHRAWKEASSYAPLEEVKAHKARHDEFARKLPAGLYDAIWPQGW